MKRLLMTTDTVGGVWTYTIDLVSALATHGIEVAIAAMGPPPSGEQREACAALENAWLFDAPFALEWMDSPWGEVDAATGWLRGLTEDFCPEVIHFNGYAHAALAWDAPVLIGAHSCVATWWRKVYRTKLPLKYAEYRRRVRAGLLAADLVATPTQAFREELELEYEIRLPGQTIYNARSSHRFHSLEKEPMIFSAGRVWDPAKNVELLVRIAPRLAWPVVVAGDAGTQNHFASAVHFLGYQSPAEIAQSCGRAGIYAAPTRYEPFGLSILEAALCGCALVLSDLPSLRELWGGCAIFVPAEDDAAWTAALNELAQNAALREWLQALARQRACRFTPEGHVTAYLQAYQTLLNPIPARLPVAL